MSCAPIRLPNHDALPAGSKEPHPSKTQPRIQSPGRWRTTARSLDDLTQEFTESQKRAGCAERQKIKICANGCSARSIQKTAKPRRRRLPLKIRAFPKSPKTGPCTKSACCAKSADCSDRPEIPNHPVCRLPLNRGQATAKPFPIQKTSKSREAPPPDITYTHYARCRNALKPPPSRASAAFGAAAVWPTADYLKHNTRIESPCNSMT